MAASRSVNRVMRRRKMTGMKAFAEQIIDVMNKEENGEMEFRTWKRLKNNGIESWGIFTVGNGRIVSPIVYLEPFL